MTRVICGVGESPETLEAVPAAVAFCRENRADLELVGTVKDTLSDATKSGAGNKIARYKQVKLELDRAAEVVREAGLSPEIVVRAGDAPRELIREAEAVGAEEVFYMHTRGRIRAALTGKPRAELSHVSLTAKAAERSLAEAA